MTWRENFSRSREALAAYFRQGFKELGSIFYGPGTNAQHPEYGMIGTRTPGEVADGLRGKDRGTAGRDQADSAPSILQSRLEQAQQRAPAEPERNEPTMERE